MGQDGLDDMFVVGQDFLQTVAGEMIARLQIQKFPEGKAAQVVGLDDPVELRVFVFKPHDG